MSELQLTGEKLDLLKRTICNGATNDELALFLHVANRTGLDPFAGQIHAVKRWDKKEGRHKMSIQIGIDGFRTIAERTGEYAGNDEPKYDVDEGAHPNRATVTVYRIVHGQRCAFSATARWSEYVQLDQHNKPQFMWQRMPFLMLAKCAEALALRKAFPAVLSGLYTTDEMGQADNPTKDVTPVPAEVPAQIAELTPIEKMRLALADGKPRPLIESKWMGARGVGSITEEEFQTGCVEIEKWFHDLEAKQ